jgi:hypothetical protein
MWILPILLLGAIVVAAASKSSREIAPTSRQLPPPSSPPTVAGLPGPISVLGEILRIGQIPSPTVILCAIAEAQSIGRSDLASDIVRVFVAPVVHAHQRGRAQRVRPGYERGSCAVRATQTEADYQRGSCAQPSAPRAEADYQRGSCARPGSPREAQPQPPSPMQGAPVTQMTSRPATEEEILSMLHVNPQTFLQMVASGRPPMIAVPIEVLPAPIVESPPPSMPMSAMPIAPPVPTAAPQPTGLPSETVAQMQEAAGLHQAADQTRAMAPGSPLGTVPDGAWREFVTRLEREPSTFDSSRHVGQYRHRRERLAELGIDPRAIHGSAAAQRAALDADLADAHGHAAAGGLLVHLGRAITMPGHDGSAKVTLSGVLGVIQCAGLEGAVGWLESQNDRKRYPHTTQAFLRTNGVF